MKSSGSIGLGAVALPCLFGLGVDARLSDSSALLYLLPLLTAVAAVMSVLWYLNRQKLQKLENELGEKSGLAEQRERERDLAQEELFRRLYEERELNKEKAQFQAQLAEYERYAALAQLALGAAHEINNPLLGILSAS